MSTLFLVLDLAARAFFLLLISFLVYSAAMGLRRFARVCFWSLNRKAFRCQRCGRCCRLMLEPSEKEIRRIEAATGQDRQRFLESIMLKRTGDKECVFLKRKGDRCRCSCRVYDCRPDVCRVWPFTGLLRSGYLMKNSVKCPAIDAFKRRK
jgi:Fe-S-cluster containining protein